MTKPKTFRIDPDSCACVDCLVGYSVPLGSASKKQLRRLAKGKLMNATGWGVQVTTTVVVGPRQVTV